MAMWRQKQSAASPGKTVLPSPALEADAVKELPQATAVSVTPAEDPKPRLAFVDVITASKIVGWAFDPQNPSVKMVVEAVSTNGKRTTTVANIFRGDVKDAKHGDGFSGFELDIGSLRLTAGTIDIRFTDSGQLISLEPIEADPQLSLIYAGMPIKYTSAMQILAAQAHQTFAFLHEIGTVF